MKATRGALAVAAILSILTAQVAIAAPRLPRPAPRPAAEHHGPMAYQHPCTAGVQRSHSAVVRGADLGFVGSDHIGAIGDAVVRNQGPCTNSTGTNYDYPLVLPANLQSSTSINRIVQIGYVRCGKPSGQMCNNVPADGKQHFIYICNDNSGGVFCDANPWAGAPVTGRRYRFRVQYNQLGTGKWDYSIRDLVTGVTKTKSITSTWHNADGVWYGGENTDTGSVMASAHVGSNDIAMYWMQYLRSSVGTWSVVTDISATSNPPDFIEVGAQPSWYGYTVFSQNYTLDGIHIWSSDHL